MSGYLALRPLLHAIAAGRALPAAAVRRAAAVTAAALTATAYEQGVDAQVRDELTWALTAVEAVARAAPRDALRALEPLFAAPLRPSPFDTSLEDVGVRLAADEGDDALLQAFLERRHAYGERFGTSAILLGLAALLTQPDWVDALAGDGDAPGAVAPPRTRMQPPTAVQPSPSTMVQPTAASHPPMAAPPSGFVPFAAESHPSTPAYVVTLRHLQDAATATFAIHRVTWHALESEDAAVSDVVLAFESDAGVMLRTLDPEALRLRLFFGSGPAYDEVATADGTLFDVEINPPEGRIYLKLRRPAAWAGTDVPIDDLWRQLRSCVLITEPR